MIFSPMDESDMSDQKRDKRSKKIALVAHCILNQNSRVLGLAQRPAAITELIEFLIHKEFGIIQMECPELTYAGVSRKRKTKAEYDNEPFRKHCRKIAEKTVDQIQEYAKCGIKTSVVIGVDGSPSCGVSKTSTCDSGILIDELRSMLKEKNIEIPFCGIHYESIHEDLGRLKKSIG
jgi:predicted secreted protein